MLLFYLKYAWRSLIKHKISSAINILGLTVGITACLLVSTVVVNDLSYDRNWVHSNDICRVISIGGDGARSASSFTGLGPNLKSNIPEILDYCRMYVAEERFQNKC